MVEIEFIQKEYPLHWLVWQNDYKQLDILLKKKEEDKEKLDNRGRTPLMLAVTLGHLESARSLLNNEANVNCENADGWTVVQEAVATGDPELLHMVLERRDFQRFSNRMAGIPELLQKLKEAPDFYVEMKWEFTSWVPLVSRMCPSDTYKVFKQGSNVRIDTTLLGFDHTSWQRGNRSYVFQGHSDGATMMEIDHDIQQVYCEEMKAPDEALGVLIPTEDSLSQRLTTPIVTTYVDTDKISFERNKAGMWGWRSDKSEVINGHECKVFSASNVELVTKTRTEHLTESDKARSRNIKTPLQNFLGIAEVEENQAASAHQNEYTKSSNPCNITPEEYFDSSVNLQNRDIGRPKEINIKVQKFKANLWLCEQYPLSLPEQILPIVDLMAISSSHFAKLKDFIQMQLPSGFPVKIEIPLFHVLNARITFGNIFGIDAEVPHVHRIQEEDRLTCVVDECIFQCPSGYSHIGNAASDGRRQLSSMEEEDDLLQFAIQQSLIDAGTEKEEVDIWEALKAQKPSRPATPNLVGEEERQLQRAIQASLELYQKNTDNNDTNAAADPELDSDLHMALMLSEQERQKQEQQRLQEEKILEEILQLSLTEK
ncbi:ankyrin repeat domain-containing protein 13D isoform X1 [Tribolium madens]|uniref:ankyrin repeat domain-containing protein 13D isoform X1 n=1 Tax=Tribolium madens TaxID=41895 RepID=UPI001CF74932|nr:ankyrin repeat domain-containing protein 13D isoform X1 [Tribolium madens]